jgi:hypothetical protein
MVAICCWIFSLVSDMGIAPRQIYRVREGKVTVHVFLDFSKAFDLINQGLFVHKLDSRYDIHMAMGMVSSFLRDRPMVIEVPHGCIPSLLFFSMFINDICSCIRFSKFHFYRLMICRFVCLGIGKICMR